MNHPTAEPFQELGAVKFEFESGERRCDWGDCWDFPVVFSADDLNQWRYCPVHADEGMAIDEKAAGRAMPWKRLLRD